METRTPPEENRRVTETAVIRMNRRQCGGESSALDYFFCILQSATCIMHLAFCVFVTFCFAFTVGDWR